MSQLGDYFRDTIAEMKHVSWPTQMQAVTYTALVIVISALTALVLGGSDYVFTQLLNVLINK